MEEVWGPKGHSILHVWAVHWAPAISCLWPSLSALSLGSYLEESPGVDLSHQVSREDG